MIDDKNTYINNFSIFALFDTDLIMLKILLIMKTWLYNNNNNHNDNNMSEVDISQNCEITEKLSDKTIII